MTAPDRTDRLEAHGLWLERPGVPPREVVVALGQTTLLLKDRAERPLGHWALPGIVRLSREGDTAVYAMVADGAETLRLRDPEMIDAIAASSSPRLAGPADRRLRLGPLLAVAAAAAAVALAAWLLPAQAARLVPDREAARLGDRLLAHVAARACADPRPAPAATATIVRRFAPEAELQILPLAVPAASLPGGRLLLDADVATATEFETVARAVSDALATDPLATVFDAAGRAADLRYLVTGRFDDAAIARAAVALAGPADPCPAINQG